MQLAADPAPVASAGMALRAAVNITLCVIDRTEAPSATDRLFPSLFEGCGLADACMRDDPLN